MVEYRGQVFKAFVLVSEVKRSITGNRQDFFSRVESGLLYKLPKR